MATDFLLVIPAAAPLPGPAMAVPGNKATVAVILVDDLGYGDRSCYGATKSQWGLHRHRDGKILNTGTGSAERPVKNRKSS
ncbi:MAG: hypothetical protein RLZZ253_279 [Verrucomicrobiota bacterium]|jgi:hypothetical protein